jgi:hypothetical protein
MSVLLAAATRLVRSRRPTERKGRFCCGRDHLDGGGCAVEELEINGTHVRRVPYGGSLAHCSGCGVKAGEHHHWTCPVEICPLCTRSTLFLCNCVGPDKIIVL